LPNGSLDATLLKKDLQNKLSRLEHLSQQRGLPSNLNAEESLLGERTQAKMK
jgi:hypothetical protein